MKLAAASWRWGTKDRKSEDSVQKSWGIKAERWSLEDDALFLNFLQKNSAVDKLRRAEDKSDTFFAKLTVFTIFIKVFTYICIYILWREQCSVLAEPKHVGPDTFLRKISSITDGIG